MPNSWNFTYGAGDHALIVIAHQVAVSNLTQSSAKHRRGRAGVGEGDSSDDSCVGVWCLIACVTSI